MLKALFSKSPEKQAGQRLYRHVVSAARRPAFYRDLGVPDTVDGRFEMIVAHAALVMRRLREGEEQGREVSQRLFDAMFKDFGQALREMGTGDSKVGKNVRAMGEAFYGRAAAYDKALAEEDEASLKEAVALNLLAEKGEAKQVEALSAWIRTCAGALAAQPLADLIQGEAPDFPEPVAEPG